MFYFTEEGTTLDVCLLETHKRFFLPALSLLTSRPSAALCASPLRTTSNMNKVFCPHCGNQTLKKVAVTLNDDGSVHMHFSKNPKVLNPSGLRVRHTTTHSHTVPCFLLRLLISEEAAEIKGCLCVNIYAKCVYTLRA